MPSLVSVWPLRPPIAVAVAVKSGLILSMICVLSKDFLSHVRSGGFAKRSLRRPTRCAEPGSSSDRDRIDQSEGNKRSALRQEDIGDITGQAQRHQANSSGDRETQQIANQRPQQSTGALRSEIQGKRKSEHPVEGADHAQIARSALEHGGVGVEERKPGIRKGRGAKADGLGENSRDTGPDPCDAQGAVALARSNAGSDHRNQRRAQPEDQGYEQ